MLGFKRSGHKSSNNTKYFKKHISAKKRKPFTPKVNRQKRKKLKPAAKRRIIIGSIVLTVLVGIFFYLTFLHNSFIISQIEITETNDDNQIPSDIQSILNTAKNQNLVTINETGLIEKIQKNHPEIANIDFKKSFPSKIRVIITYHPQLANLIINDTPSNLPHKFIINNAGKIFKNNADNPNLPTLILKNINDKEFEDIMSEEIIFNGERVQKAIDAAILFEKNFDIKITKTQYYKTEREAHLLSEKGFYVWLDLTKNIEEQLNKLKRSTGKLDLHKDSLIYIDLRINCQNGEKIIFKRTK